MLNWWKSGGLMLWALLMAGCPAREVPVTETDRPPAGVTGQPPCPVMLVDSALYAEGWDSLAQPLFWRRIMTLSPDTVLVNIGRTREIVGAVTTDFWGRKSQREKDAFADSVRQQRRLPKSEEIFFTAGKNQFYRFELVAPDLKPAMDIFESLGVDPWFAQAIMLIESPVGLQFSTAGAYGPFQLMEGVAKEFGLIVNDSLDEREVFECSAEGAARLIQTVCVPKARAMAEFHQLPYDEQDTWFRLLVLHVYHAGAGNVRGVLGKIKPSEGGVPLIQQIWQTKHRRFENSSQNYTQLALAALLEAEKVVARMQDSCKSGTLSEGENLVH